MAHAAPAQAAEGDWRRGDAGIDRHLLLPSAQTLGQGEVSYTNMDLFVHGVSFGLRDDLQLSAGTFFSLIWVSSFQGLVSLKWRALARRHLTLSGMAVLDYAYNVHDVHVVNPMGLVLIDVHSADGVVTWITRLGGFQPFAFGEGDDGAATTRPVWLFASGLRAVASAHFAFLADLLFGGSPGHLALASRRDEDLGELVILALGAHFFWPGFALDLAVGETFGLGDSRELKPWIPLPLLSGTWRF